MIHVLKAFNLTPSEFTIAEVGTGHIHKTYRLSAGNSGFILQRVNKNVFKNPEIIASNLKGASNFLAKNFSDYEFLRSIPTVDGAEMYYDNEEFPWRLFPYRANTITFDKVDSDEQAYKAAAGFAGLTARLDLVDVTQFQETISGFHNLTWRYKQFSDALRQAGDERKLNSKKAIENCLSFRSILETYEKLLDSHSLRLRITHNDTKINNILFDEKSEETLVIDLDTLMPGYFIYDLGDMVRTFVSPVTEEEKDYSKITFRKAIYEAVLEGYLSQMDHVLSAEEKQAIPFAGKMMTLIMALRFLTDYLNDDVYYHTHYPEQNLVRAENQLTFLKILEQNI